MKVLKLGRILDKAILFLFFLSVGCVVVDAEKWYTITREIGVPKLVNRPVYINQEFVEFVQQFERCYNVKVDVTIRFADEMPIFLDSDLEDPTLAWCATYIFMGIKEILIRREKWIGFDYNKRRLIIFHELGHCVGNIQDHDDSITVVDEELIPISNSIMNSLISDWSSYYISEHWDFYVSELGSKMNKRKEK